MFALNHERLRHGGRELLSGTGDLAQQLFGAGLGRDIHDVLAGLQADADEIFTARARTRVLNQEITAYSDTKRRMRELILRPDTWATAQQELEEKRAERKTCDERIRALATQRATLERYRKVLPALAIYDDHKRAREELGEVVLLAPEATQERKDAQRILAEAGTRIERLRTAITEAERDLAALSVPESLLEQKAQIDILEVAVGAQHKAAQDLTGLQSRLRTHEEQARDVLRQLGKKGAGLDQARDLVLPVARQARIREFVGQRHVLDERQRGFEKRIGAEQRRIAKVTQELQACAAPVEVGGLLAALEAARAQGDLADQRVAAEDEIARRRQQAETALAALGLWSGSLEEVERVPLPPLESVARFEKRWQEAERGQEALRGEVERLQQELDACEDQLGALRREGEVPTTKELEELRKRRDQGWVLVRRTWLEGADTAAEAHAFDAERPLADAYEHAVRQADAAADNLRQAADRAANYEQLLARRDENAQKRKAKTGELERHTASQTVGAQEWQALWQPAGITALPPAEMRSWIERHARLLERTEELHEAERQAERLREKEAAARAALTAALAPLGKTVPETEPLAALLVRAEGRAAAARDTAQTRDGLGRELREHTEMLEELEADRTQSRGELETWRKNWGEAVTGLDLGPDALPEEAEAVLERTAELERNLDGMEGYQRRIHEIEQDAKEFAERVRQLANECAPDLAALPPTKAATDLLARFRQGELDQTKRTAIEKDLKEKRTALQEQELRAGEARDELDRLQTAARCESVEALEEAERTSARARELDTKIDAARRQIVELGAGATVEELREQTSDVEADALPAQIEEVQRQIAEVETERSALDQDIGGRKTELERMDGGPAAAEAAAEAQEQLARIRGLARDYARHRLAAHLLEREIETYRKANQGPLLDRAGELFRRLTLGCFETLGVDYDDVGKPLLLCVRDDGRAIPPQHRLSDGEADQLYLALRIAGLERHLQTNQPLPFIADDIYVNFDDDRARAGFEVLGELARRTQVIFFTHHTRLRDLAREALSPETLGQHALD